MDQAEGLRNLMNDISPLHSPRVIAVSSGKGGVGKTNVVANLAFAFTQMGKRVLVLDADLGLANIDVLLGLAPRYTIEHLFNRQRRFSDIVVKGPGGMSIIPAGSGIVELVDLSDNEKLFLMNELDRVAEEVDILLIDTGAGISSNVLYFNMAAQESIVIVTAEPTSITDGYALIKVLSNQFKKKHFLVLANSVKSDREGREVFMKISRVADRFLGSISIDYLGFIPLDEKVPRAVRLQRAFLEIYPQAPSSRSILGLAKTLCERPARTMDNGSIQFFWKQLLERDRA